jgi:hypothetical protein
MDGGAVGSIAGDLSVMFGVLGPQLQLWRTRGERNTAKGISVLGNAFVPSKGNKTAMHHYSPTEQVAPRSY